MKKYIYMITISLICLSVNQIFFARPLLNYLESLRSTVLRIKQEISPGSELENLLDIYYQKAPEYYMNFDLDKKTDTAKELKQKIKVYKQKAYAIQDAIRNQVADLPREFLLHYSSIPEGLLDIWQTLPAVMGALRFGIDYNLGGPYDIEQARMAINDLLAKIGDAIQKNADLFAPVEAVPYKG